MTRIITLLLTMMLGLPNITWATTHPILRFNTDNGIPVVFYQAMEVPIVSINIAFQAGSAYDKKAFGLSALTTDMLNEGSDNLNATEIAEALASTGAQFNAQSTRDMVVISLKTLVEPNAYAKASALFKTIATLPSFNADAFNRVKNQQIQSIKQLQESPDEVANQIFFKTLYGEHPYGHPLTGLVDTVSSIQLNDVKQFYKTYFVRDNAIIVIVGALTPKDAKVLADNLSSAIPKGQKAPAIPRAAPLNKSTVVKTPFPSTQTSLRLGQMGITHNSPLYFPLLVGNYTLGGGTLVSQLATEVREKRGLTYGVYSQFVPMPGVGPFIISLSTRNTQATEALSVTEKTLKSFLKLGPTAVELQAAKDFLTGSFPLSLSSNTDIANVLLRMAFYHLPDDYLDTYVANINRVTQKDIMDAFKTLVNPDIMVEVSVGKV